MTQSSSPRITVNEIKRRVTRVSRAAIVDQRRCTSVADPKDSPPETAVITNNSWRHRVVSSTTVDVLSSDGLAHEFGNV